MPPKGHKKHGNDQQEKQKQESEEEPDIIPSPKPAGKAKHLDTETMSWEAINERYTALKGIDALDIDISDIENIIKQERATKAKVNVADLSQKTLSKKELKEYEKASGEKLQLIKCSFLIARKLVARVNGKLKLTGTRAEIEKAFQTPIDKLPPDLKLHKKTYDIDMLLTIKKLVSAIGIESKSGKKQAETMDIEEFSDEEKDVSDDDYGFHNTSDDENEPKDDQPKPKPQAQQEAQEVDESQVLTPDQILSQLESTKSQLKATSAELEKEKDKHKEYKQHYKSLEEESTKIALEFQKQVLSLKGEVHEKKTALEQLEMTQTLDVNVQSDLTEEVKKLRSHTEELMKERDELRLKNYELEEEKKSLTNIEMPKEPKSVEDDNKELKKTAQPAGAPEEPTPEEIERRRLEREAEAEADARADAEVERRIVEAEEAERAKEAAKTKLIPPTHRDLRKEDTDRILKHFEPCPSLFKFGRNTAYLNPKAETLDTAKLQYLNNHMGSGRHHIPTSNSIDTDAFKKYWI